MIRFFLESAGCFVLYRLATMFVPAEELREFFVFCLFTGSIYVFGRVGLKLEQVLRLKKEEVK